MNIVKIKRKKRVHASQSLIEFVRDEILDPNCDVGMPWSGVTLDVIIAKIERAALYVKIESVVFTHAKLGILTTVINGSRMYEIRDLDRLHEALKLGLGESKTFFESTVEHVSTLLDNSNEDV